MPGGQQCEHASKRPGLARPKMDDVSACQLIPRRVRTAETLGTKAGQNRLRWLNCLSATYSQCSISVQDYGDAWSSIWYFESLTYISMAKPQWHKDIEPYQTSMGGWGTL